MSETTMFIARWLSDGNGSKSENIVLEVSLSEVVFKDPQNEFHIFERYNYSQIRAWTIGSTISLSPPGSSGLIRMAHRVSAGR